MNIFIFQQKNLMMVLQRLFTPPKTELVLLVVGGQVAVSVNSQ